MRNEIEKILKEMYEQDMSEYSVEEANKETTDQILALIEGSLPKRKKPMTEPDESGSFYLDNEDNAYSAEDWGWNACLEAMLDNLKEKGE